MSALMLLLAAAADALAVARTHRAGIVRGDPASTAASTDIEPRSDADRALRGLYESPDAVLAPRAVSQPQRAVEDERT